MSLPMEKDRKFTYADYATWPEDQRWELIDGEAYDMTPAPSTLHQAVVLHLGSTLNASLQDSPCRCFVAPTDVVFSEHDVVQPDVLVVCDRSRITEANIQGPPDLVVEVLSPSTGVKDKREKKNLYERYGVREYVLVDVTLKCVERLSLGPDGLFGKAEIFGPDDTMELASLPGIKVKVGDLFEDSA